MTDSNKDIAFFLIILKYTLRIVSSFVHTMQARSKSHTVQCLSLPVAKLKRFLPPGDNPGLLCTIVVCQKTGKELGAKTGDWVCVRKQNQGPATFVQLIINAEVRDDEALVSDTLLYNVANGQLNEQESLEILPPIDITFPLANELVVSLLRCPSSWNADDVDSLLVSFFSSPKYLSRNDVFSVEAENYAPLLLLSRWDPEVDDATLWFRVETLEGEVVDVKGYRPCMKVKREVTAVKLGPISKERGYPVVCPFGLTNNSKELQKAAKSFLINDVRRRPPMGSGLLLRGGAGRKEVLRSFATSLGLKAVRLNCRELQVAGGPGQPEAKLKAVAAQAASRAPSLLVLDNLEVLGWDREGGGEDARVETALFNVLQSLPVGKVIAVGVTGISCELAPGVARTWLPGTSLPECPPSDCGTGIRHLLARLDNYTSHLPQHLPASGTKETQALAFHALRNKLFKKAACDKNESHDLEEQHWQHALECLKRESGAGLGLAQVPAVSWSDVGGLEEVRKDVLRTVALPLRYPALRAAGLRRSGVLLHGPPGTGKTLVAKAVASECGLNFLSVKGPELLSMYVGQSEANVRDLFARARAAAPSIVFFDELDALAPSRGRGGDGGGNVTDRVVSQLMAEMDGMTHRPNAGEAEEPPVFVMAATNRPDLVEPALLRPGRFDKLLYVGPCVDQTAQLGVLTALTRKFHLSADVNLEEVVACLPPNTPLTGADLYSACAAAWRSALRERVAAEEQGKGTRGPVEVSMHHFKAAMSTMKATVTSTPDLLTSWKQ